MLSNVVKVGACGCHIVFLLTVHTIVLVVVYVFICIFAGGILALHGNIMGCIIIIQANLHE